MSSDAKAPPNTVFKYHAQNNIHYTSFLSQLVSQKLIEYYFKYIQPFCEIRSGSEQPPFWLTETTFSL